MVLKRGQTLIKIMENPPYQVGYHNSPFLPPYQKGYHIHQKLLKYTKIWLKEAILRLFLAISNSEYEQGSGRDDRTHSN